MAARSAEVGYFDLFAGPGRFNDGQPSTPLQILEIASKSPVVSSKLKALFNDADSQIADRLRQEIDGFPGIGGLRFKPEVTSNAVDDKYIEFFKSRSRFPALTFLDPWGYKGLSRQLIAAVVRDFGCETIFFFNYSRFNAAIDQGKVDDHLEALLDKEILHALRSELIAAKSPQQRERLVVRAVGDSLGLLGPSQHMIPFRMSRPGGKRHYLWFITKHPLGFMFMKEVMAKLGVCDQDGVPVFEYDSRRLAVQGAFADFRPLAGLPGQLSEQFKARSLNIDDLWAEHQVGQPFIRSNYKQVVLEMEQRGEVSISRPRGSGASTLGPKALITFPA
jgi:three-Cys-motif partner protein